jgi:hypothetical protein
MKIKILIMSLTMFFSPPLLAGSLDSPAAPNHADSAMFTLTDIYNRLNDGTTVNKRSGAVVEPTSGPTTGTGYTLNDIMDIAPEINANGAIPAQVLNGKFYWGLLNGLWGLQQGTATAGADVNGADGSLQITIPDGFYSSNTATANDSDLTTANIKNGVDIFGVTGSVVEATGDAIAAEVLTGKTFSNAGNAGVSGSMPNNNAVTITPSTTAQTIAAGYHNGSGTVEGDADLTAANIKNGVDIFGVTGSVVEATGNATAADVLTGKTFSNDSGAGVSGSMPNNNAVTITPSTTEQTIAAGYHNGSGTVEGDADLTAANIKNGVDIFGVTGSVVEATGNATAADVLTGKTFSNDSGAGVSGTMANQGTVTITPSTTAQTIAAGYHNGSGTVEGDADLDAANIKNGVEIFGVTGTYGAVAKTGQNQCYDEATNNAEACVAAEHKGQDGFHQKGASVTSRFTDNSDGTVTDNLTGLIWLKNANCAGSKMVWWDALDFAYTLYDGSTSHNSGDCGLDDGSSAEDWRLPNVKELQSLIDFSQYGPALSSGHPFENVVTGYYRSSSTNVNNTSKAWYVYINDGRVLNDSKTVIAYVWPVRGKIISTGSVD